MRHLAFVLIALAALFAAACNSPADAPSDTPQASESPSSIADVVSNAQNNDDNSSPPNSSTEPGDTTDTGAPSETTGTASGSSNNSTPSGEQVSSQRATVLKLDTPERRRLVQAVESTNNLESYEFEWSMTLPTIADLPGGLSLSGTGAMDPANERFAMTIDFTDLFTALAESGGGTAEELELMQALFGNDPMQMRFVDGVVYIRWALFSSLLGNETPWISFEDETGSGGFDALSSAGSPISSPQDATAFLNDVWGIEEIGRETVRGVETTHYRGVIDLVELMGSLSPAELNELEAELEGVSLSEVFGDFPIDVWIDDNNVMRRFIMDIDFTGHGPAGLTAESILGSMSLRYEFFNLGVPLTIEAPPASEVTPVGDSLLNGFAFAA